MSLRRFDGWVPATATVYEYDDDGRLVRSVSTPESEWDEHQQSLMLALGLLDRLTCDGCGGHLPDTTGMDADYEVDLPVRCHRCTAIAAKADEYKEAQHPQALRFPAHVKKGGGR